MSNLAERQAPVGVPLTRNEAAALFQVSVRTIDRLIADGTLDRIPLPGRAVRISRASVEALLRGERAS